MVSKITKLLVTTDGSHPAVRVAEVGLRLAASMNIPVVALYVHKAIYRDYVTLGGHMRDESPDLDPYQRIVESVQTTAETMGVDLETVVTIAKDVAVNIDEVAAEYGCDLIVCGTHGRRGLTKLIMGSTVHSLLRQPGPPLFVVPPHSGVCLVPGVPIAGLLLHPEGGLSELAETISHSLPGCRIYPSKSSSDLQEINNEASDVEADFVIFNPAAHQDLAKAVASAEVTKIMAGSQFPIIVPRIA